MGEDGDRESVLPGSAVSEMARGAPESAPLRRSECLADEVVGELAEGFTARTREHTGAAGSIYRCSRAVCMKLQIRMSGR